MRSDNPPESDVALFREIAETLYGPHPADLLADALEVNIRSVQRWLAGQNRVPDAIWGKMYTLLRGVDAACQRLLGKADDSAL